MNRKKYSKNKQINALVREMLKQGYIYKRGGKHGKIISPDGKVKVTVPGTPSDWRASNSFG
ncbi:hypothetical protein LH51_16410 [Nitrincola sp. A-D6]|uniref:hypothetical protein n=1 Tax=Nitrincola sp. A-D6 TaxID=1545442 RepID=UPI00051FB7BA|nr:hypothetical protein [Nitrincola sp. A-D6]KGK41192.1 hypothetical protein LH51_16410 [Nitrincola sp. A-D6]